MDLIEDFNYVLSWTSYKTFSEMIYVHHQSSSTFCIYKDWAREKYGLSSILEMTTAYKL